MHIRVGIIIFILFTFVLQGWSQPKGKKMDVEDADEHLKHGNYIMALPIYRDILKKEPDNKKVQYKLGLCYLNTLYNRTESIKNLEAVCKDEKFDEEAWFNLGHAYHLAGRIDEAIKTFEKYKSKSPKKAAIADRQIQMCNNAKMYMNSPSNVTFTNLGKEVNSEDPDYYPFVNADETFLAFTSRRKENMGGKNVEVDGYHPSDIYYSKLENGKWGKAVNPGNVINSNLDEQVVWLKPDGTEMMVYMDHIEKFGDLYLSVKKNGTGDFPKPKLLPEQVNKKIETSGCFSPDGNSIFFARKENVGAKSDIYVCRKLPTGVWGEAYKLPEEINTEYNEDFPYISPDGLTLYFSSEGHNSMGGFDLFKSVYNTDNNTWSKAENLGFPINSCDNDRSISLTPDNRAGYISAFRPGGFGDLDIYRIRFNENQQVVRIITGKIFLGDSSARPQTIASIIAKSKANNEEYTFIPNPKNGKYVVALGAGTYSVTVRSDGYSNFDEVITISDLGSVEMEKNKNYLLKLKPGGTETPQKPEPEKPKTNPKPKQK